MKTYELTIDDTELELLKDILDEKIDTLNVIIMEELSKYDNDDMNITKRDFNTELKSLDDFDKDEIPELEIIRQTERLHYKVLRLGYLHSENTEPWIN